MNGRVRVGVWVCMCVCLFVFVYVCVLAAVLRCERIWTLAGAFVCAFDFLVGSFTCFVSLLGRASVARHVGSNPRSAL